MATKNVNELLVALEGDNEFLRNIAFDQLLKQAWAAGGPKANSGRYLLLNYDLIDDLLGRFQKFPPDLQNKVAWFFGVLLEVDNDPKSEIQKILTDHIGLFLEAVKNIITLNEQNKELQLIDGFLFLFGHFPKAATLIEQEFLHKIDSGLPNANNLSLIFLFAENYPERSRFLLNYLGANACSQATDSRVQIFNEVLACPECQSSLNYSEECIECAKCKAHFNWGQNIPQLVPRGCNDPEEYPEELVKIYEAETRPRFIRVMGHDWASLITAKRERDYISDFLHPVDGPILDLACGVGNLTQTLVDLFGEERVIGLDFSNAMLHFYRNRYKRSIAVRGSSSVLPIANASLGGVNCSDAIQALPDPSLAFNEIARCMLPGATFTGFTFLEAAWPYNYFQHRLHQNERRLFTVDQIKSFLTKSQLETIDITVVEKAIFFAARKAFH